MNEDKLAGEGRDIAGKVKETVGDVTGNASLQGEGLGDQLAGKAQKIVGAARDALSADGEPLADKARRFARERPWAIAALAGVLGIALINTLRGKR
jgi:uncharacterized protein YjbJ (UPF0337 family)